MSVDSLVSLASSIQSGPGVFALLLGSGVSKSAGIPTGWDITKILAQRVADAEGADAGGDSVDWYRERYGDDPAYSDLVAQLARSPGDRVNLLRGLLEEPEEGEEQGSGQFSQAHSAVAALAAKGYVRVIVTTNFDRLLELALNGQGVQPTVITDSASARGAMPLAHSSVTIIKVNGDYQSANFKNTIEELDCYDEEIERLLHEVFTQYGLVVCGWSADYDVALRRAIAGAEQSQFSTYWLHKGAIEAESEAARLIALREAIEVPIEDAGDTLGGVEATVDALADAAGQRVVSADMAVAQIKRFLPDEAHRIRLHSLVTGETQAAVEELAGIESQELNGGTPISAGERVQAYEAATATLLRLLVVGSRFSNRQDHDDLWAECVDRLANRSMPLRSGNTYAIRMQFYPVLLALYAIALGSAAAGRVASIAHTLTAVEIKRPLPDRIHRRVPVTASFESLDNGQFPEPITDKGNSTPSSDHLLGVMRDAAADVIPGDERLEDFFDEAEYLLGVAGAAQLAPLRLGFVTTVGRAAWRLLRDGGFPEGLVRRHENTLIEKGVFQSAGDVDTARNAHNQKMDKLRRWIDPFYPHS